MKKPGASQGRAIAAPDRRDQFVVPALGPAYAGAALLRRRCHISRLSEPQP